MLLCHGLAARGWCRGDAFVVSSIGLVVALIAVFVFFPVTTILASAVRDNAGAFAPGDVRRQVPRPLDLGPRLPHLRTCAAASPGTPLFLATLVGVGTTALGLAFALIATRTDFRFKRALRVLTVLPIITPPFVIGLALILLFGRSGAFRPCSSTGSTSRARAGSTACRASSSRSSSPSRRSPSWS